MAEYEVHTGLNVGPEDKRFEPGDKITDDDLPKEAVEWLLSDGHITLCEQRSGSGAKRQASRRRSSSTREEASTDEQPAVESDESEGDDA